MNIFDKSNYIVKLRIPPVGLVETSLSR